MWREAYGIFRDSPAFDEQCWNIRTCTYVSQACFTGWLSCFLDSGHWKGGQESKGFEFWIRCNFPTLSTFVSFYYCVTFKSFLELSFGSRPSGETPQSIYASPKHWHLVMCVLALRFRHELICSVLPLRHGWKHVLKPPHLILNFSSFDCWL